MFTLPPAALARPEVPLRLMPHARLRMAQRNLSLPDLQYGHDYGTPFHREGDCHLVLRACDIPRRDRGFPAIARLEGLVLVIAPDGWIKTVYRNPTAPRTIRRKPKTRWGFRPTAPRESRSGQLPR